MNIKECVLEDRKCTDCGECNICDLDPQKVCDNCCACIDGTSDYRSVEIDDVLDDDESLILDTEDLDNWKYDEDYTVEYSDEEAQSEDLLRKKHHRN